MCRHTYSMASTRLVLDVCAGDEHTSKHGAPSLWALIDRLPRDLMAGAFARRLRFRQ
jgi:hypothetical protein